MKNFIDSFYEEAKNTRLFPFVIFLMLSFAIIHWKIIIILFFKENSNFSKTESLQGLSLSLNNMVEPFFWAFVAIIFFQICRVLYVAIWQFGTNTSHIVEEKLKGMKPINKDESKELIDEIAKVIQKNKDLEIEKGKSILEIDKLVNTRLSEKESKELKDLYGKILKEKVSLISEINNLKNAQILLNFRFKIIDLNSNKNHTEYIKTITDLDRLLLRQINGEENKDNIYKIFKHLDGVNVDLLVKIQTIIIKARDELEKYKYEDMKLFSELLEKTTEIIGVQLYVSN